MPIAKPNAFPKVHRLREPTDFKKVYQAGDKRASRSFVVFARPNGLSYSRLGLTTPRKFGKAHERNRIKRRLREVFRTSQTRIPKGFDFVINPRRSAIEREFGELRLEWMAVVGADH